MLGYTFIPRTLEAEAGESLTLSQPGLQSKFKGSQSYGGRRREEERNKIKLSL